MAQLHDLPLREELRGETAYGAPQLRVAYQLNTNENPFPPSPALVDALVDEVRRCASSLNRYPERDAVELRTELARYVSQQTGVDVTYEQVWAANGSNEVMTHLLLAFGGPGRRLLIFAPTYSMYPEYARNTLTEYVTAPRRDDYTLQSADILAAIEEHQPDIVGMSAFLTTTMPMFKANINTLEKAGKRDSVIIMVGGAPVTQEYADVVGADLEGLREPVGAGLHGVGERDAELRAVAQQSAELLRIRSRGDHQDVADPRQDQRGERVVDHRLVVDGQQLLADGTRDRIQARA